MSKRNASWMLILPAGLVMLAVFVYPVGDLLLSSFSREGGGLPSLDRFIALAEDPFIRGVLLRTIVIGLLATLICLLIGLPLAHAYVRSSGWIRSLIMISVMAPLLINHVVRTYGWAVILGNGGVLDKLLHFLGFEDAPLLMYTTSAVLIGLVSVFTPFMVLTLIPAFARIDANLYSAATSLGASGLRQWFTIVLPLVRPGVVAGSVLVFALTQGAFVAPLMLGGSSAQMTATLVYTDAMVLGDWPRATATAVVLLVLVLLVISSQSRLGKVKWQAK